LHGGGGVIIINFFSPEVEFKKENEHKTKSEFFHDQLPLYDIIFSIILSTGGEAISHDFPTNFGANGVYCSGCMDTAVAALSKVLPARYCFM
jgi:hypothetical protein